MSANTPGDSGSAPGLAAGKEAGAARPAPDRISGAAAGLSTITEAPEEYEEDGTPLEPIAERRTCLAEASVTKEEENRRVDSALTRRMMEVPVADPVGTGMIKCAPEGACLDQPRGQITADALAVWQEPQPLTPAEAATSEQPSSEREQRGWAGGSVRERIRPLMMVCNRRTNGPERRVVVHVRNAGVQLDAPLFTADRAWLAQVSRAEFLRPRDPGGGSRARPALSKAHGQPPSTTPHELPRFVRPPFGLKSTGSVYMRLVRAAMNAYEMADFRWAYLDDVIISGGDAEIHLQRLRIMLELLRRSGTERDADESSTPRNSAKHRGCVVLMTRHALDLEDVCRAPKWPRPRTGRNPQAFLELIGQQRNVVREHDQLPTELAESQIETVDAVWREKLKSNVDRLGMTANSAAGEEPPDESAGAESALQSPATDGREPPRHKGRMAKRFPRTRRSGIAGRA